MQIKVSTSAGTTTFSLIYPTTASRSTAHPSSPSLPPPASLAPIPPMGKRKVKNKVLTKIDPSLFKLKPQATSLHAAGDGTRVTTTVQLTNHSDSLKALPTSPNFFVDVPDTTNEGWGDDGADDDVSRGYYVARVCFFSPLCYVLKLIIY